MFAFVRSERLESEADIHAASFHAFGADRTARSRRREGYNGPRAVTLIKSEDSSRWRKAKLIHPPDGDSRPKSLPTHVDYKAAFRRHLKANAAYQVSNSDAAMHLIVGVSPQWFERPDGTHEGHDINSRKVRRLVTAAVQWAEAELGGVWAARYDLDERGFGIVDVMCSPIRTDGRSGKQAISIRKAQGELQVKYPGAAKGYGAMQSSWADYATDALGATFDRGVPKRYTGREHLIAEEYGSAMDAGRRRMSALETQIQGMEQLLKRVRLERDALKKQLESARKALHRIGSRLTSWALSRYRAASRPTLPEDPEHEELAEEAVGLAVTLSALADSTGEPVEKHRARVKDRVRRGRRTDGWGDDHPEAPLHAAWEAESMEVPDCPSYEDWRHDLAHASARGVTADRRDLIRLARRVEKSLGRYQTRAERRRRRQRASAAEGR